MLSSTTAVLSTLDASQTCGGQDACQPIGTSDRTDIPCVPSDPEFPEEGCGMYSCDTHGPELRAAVARIEATPAIDPEGALRQAEELHGCTLDRMMDGDLCADIALSHESDSKRGQGGRWKAHSPILAALRAGHSIVDVAKATGLPVELIVRTIADSTITVVQVLDVERLLRLGAVSFAAVAREAGVDRFVVTRLASSLGLKAGAPVRYGWESTVVYPQEMVDEAWRLRNEGKTYRAIQVALGFEVNDGEKALIATALLTRARRQHAEVAA